MQILNIYPGMMKENLWRMPKSKQSQCGCQFGKEYPFPIVDLNKSRYGALNAFID